MSKKGKKKEFDFFLVLLPELPMISRVSTLKIANNIPQPKLVGMVVFNSRILMDSLANQYLIEIGQGFKDMSLAIRTLEEMIIDKRINHGGHPVLSWMASCVVIVEDDVGNVKFSKKKSKGKIDAVVALAMALFRSKVHPPEEFSVYKTRGLLTINAQI